MGLKRQELYNIFLKEVKKFVGLKVCFKFAAEFMAHGVTGNTSGFGPEESRFEP